MANAADSRKALGRGLSTLLPTNRPAPTPSAAPVPPATSGPLRIPIGDIDPNPLQPRTVFQADRLQELAQSIREHGIIQPLIVRFAGSRYQLVAGERRWRAAKLAGLAQVPVIVQDYADDRLMEITLIENIQREDLNPIEVAQAFDRLAHEHQLSHEQIAQRTGKDRTTVTNMLRLLRLPGDIQVLLAEHRLSMGHARAILALPTPEHQLQLAERTAAEGLSVRQVERLVQKATETREAKPAQVVEPDPNVKAAIQELERVLGTRVHIVEKSPQRGRIEIEYYSQDDLDRVYETIVGDK
jgi:ParB family transcriptional regulator, chromosome partitioning protein